MGGGDVTREIGQCSARGPYGEQCTDPAGHRYAHIDVREDVAWTDRTEDHDDDCRCDNCRPESYR